MVNWDVDAECSVIILSVNSAHFGNLTVIHPLREALQGAVPHGDGLLQT